jgi:hypothetical protein
MNETYNDGPPIYTGANVGIEERELKSLSELWYIPKSAQMAGIPATHELPLPLRAGGCGNGFVA